MKLAAFLSVAFSLSAMACPDLQGVYRTCKGSSMADMFTIRDVVVTQGLEGASSTPVYYVKYIDAEGSKSLELMADGKWTAVGTGEIGSDEEITAEMRVNCENDMLVMENKAEVMGMSMEGKEVFKKNEAGNLVIESYLDGELANRNVCK